MSRPRTLAALLLLEAALPLNLVLTGVALVRGAVTTERREVAAVPRTVLVSGGKMTKALALARAFHRAGHRVILVEAEKYRLTGHRFSRCVDRFLTVPRPDDPSYADALLDIVRREGVDVYVPVCSPLASYYDALAARTLAPYCEVLHGDADLIARLDDKGQFVDLAASLGLPVPDTQRVTSPAQVEAFDFAAGAPPYVLKSIAYDPVHRLDLTPLPRPTRSQTTDFATSRAITPETPWILQSFVTGQEICTHGTCRDGRLQVWACCPSSAFQVNYAMVDLPQVEAWVRGFVEPLGVTGQFSFDFIVDDDGGVHPIECNPRTHSAITMFYDHPDLARAYLEDLDEGEPPITPTTGSRPTYWLYHELWRLLCRPASLLQRARVVWEGKDALWDPHDPWPFLLVPHLQIPALLWRNLLSGKDFIRVDFNIGKLVEAAGD